jgi:hypothetical protein
MSAPDRVGANRSRIGCHRHHKYASLFNRLSRCSSPRHGAVGGWHFCEMPKGVLFRGSLINRKTGTPVRWYAGKPVRQHVGTPVRWYASPPVRWCVSPPARRHAGALAHRTTGPSADRFSRAIPNQVKHPFWPSLRPSRHCQKIVGAGFVQTASDTSSAPGGRTQNNTTQNNNCRCQILAPM